MSTPAIPASLPAAPPPPGKQSNFINPQTSMRRAIALHAVCLSLVTLCVAIRIYTRHFITRKLGLDDALCILAFLLTIIFSTLTLISDARGVGRHIWDVPAIDLSPGILSVLTYSEFIYLPLVGVIKLSCLLFYRRVFSPSPTAKWFIYGGMALVVSAYIALFFATLFECSPVKRSWYPELQGHCLPVQGLPWASGAINVVSDIYVMVVPIPCIWQLNMKLQRKLRILAIFSLAAFVCATSIVRLAMTRELYNGSIDTTWNLFQISTWAVIEVNIGIVCSCSLAFPAFFDRHGLDFPSLMSRLRSLTASWRSEKSYASDGSRRTFNALVNRSGEAGMDEYTKLKVDNNIIEMRGASHVAVSPEDVELGRVGGNQ